MRNIIKALSSVVLASALVITGASASLAIGAGSGSGGDNSPTVPKPGGGTGGGNTTPVNPVPPSWRWVSMPWVEFQETYEPIRNTCAARRASDNAPLTGATVRFKLHNNGLRTGGKLICHYPPSFSLSSVTCVISSDVSIEMVAPNRKTLGSKSVNTAYAASRSLEDCKGSASQVYLETQPKEYGRYRAFASTLVQYCQEKRWATDSLTGVTAPAELVNCGGERRINPSEARGELSCAGWRDGWTARNDWSETACRDTTAPTYRCEIPQPTIYGEARKNSQALRDGSVVPVRWGTPTVAGGSIRAVGSASTLLETSGEPSTAGRADKRLADIERNGRSVLKTMGETTGWVQGVVTEWDVRIYTAGGGLRLTPTWQWNVTVEKTGIIFAGVNPLTGVWEKRATSVMVNTTARCSDAVSIEALRIVNDVR